MFIVGIILLLPGLCALLYGLDLIYGYSGPYFSLFVTGTLIGILGV